VTFARREPNIAAPEQGDDAPAASSETGESSEPAALTPVEHEQAPDEDDGGEEPKRRRGLRRLLPKPVWQVGRVLLILLIIEYLVVPQLAGPRKVAHLITQVNPFLLLAGVGLEVLSLICYAQLTRTVLPDDQKLGLFRLLRIQMTTLSLSHSAPGGSATGTALGYRLLTQSGVRRHDVGFALAAQGIGSAVVLNLILWVALIVSIPVWGFSAVYGIAAGVGVVLLAASAALLFLFTRGEERVGGWLERAAGHVPFIDGLALRRSFVQVSERLADLGSQRRLVGHGILWATGNWLLDAASLWVFVGAFGHFVNPDGLLVAYGLANVLAAIPITPGGLGVVEATLTTILVGFGTPRGAATLGVVAYRLINFWLPIPLGGVAYLSLQVDKAGSRADHHGLHAVLDRLLVPFRWRRRRSEPPDHGTDESAEE
jgi:uncharacterized protein (TIRG00374 family)